MISAMAAPPPCRLRRMQKSPPPLRRHLRPSVHWPLGSTAALPLRSCAPRPTNVTDGVGGGDSTTVGVSPAKLH